MTKIPVPVAFLAGAVTAAVATAIAVRKKIASSETELLINIPNWLTKVYQANKGKTFKTDDEMIDLAIRISAQNVAEGSGGPFGCAIYERDPATKSAKLISVGANRVVPLANSTLHAEMVAIQFAQKKLENFSLKDATPGKEYVLCTSCEPCCMCLGGTMWSGVTELMCAAAKDDAEKIGFNEGPVFPESYKELEKVGIKVKKGVKRAEGAKVLEDYGKTGVIYNA